MVKKKRGRIQFCRDELERLKRRAAVAAETLLKGTKNLPDPEVNVEKKKTPNVKINETVGQALVEIDALGLAEQKEKKKEAEKQKKVEEEKKKEAGEAEKKKVAEDGEQMKVEEEEKSEEEVVLRRFDQGFEK